MTISSSHDYYPQWYEYPSRATPITGNIQIWPSDQTQQQLLGAGLCGNSLEAQMKYNEMIQQSQAAQQWYRENHSGYATPYYEYEIVIDIDAIEL